MESWWPMTCERGAKSSAGGGGHVMQVHGGAASTRLHGGCVGLVVVFIVPLEVLRIQLAEFSHMNAECYYFAYIHAPHLPTYKRLNARQQVSQPALMHRKSQTQITSIVRTIQARATRLVLTLSTVFPYAASK